MKKAFLISCVGGALMCQVYCGDSMVCYRHMNSHCDNVLRQLHQASEFRSDSIRKNVDGCDSKCYIARGNRPLNYNELMQMYCMAFMQYNAKIAVLCNMMQQVAKENGCKFPVANVNLPVMNCIPFFMVLPTVAADRQMPAIEYVKEDSDDHANDVALVQDGEDDSVQQEEEQPVEAERGDSIVVSDVEDGDTLVEDSDDRADDVALVQDGEDESVQQEEEQLVEAERGDSIVVSDVEDGDTLVEACDDQHNESEMVVVPTDKSVYHVKSDGLAWRCCKFGFGCLGTVAKFGFGCLSTIAKFGFGCLGAFAKPVLVQYGVNVVVKMMESSLLAAELGNLCKGLGGVVKYGMQDAWMSLVSELGGNYKTSAWNLMLKNKANAWELFSTALYKIVGMAVVREGTSFLLRYIKVLGWL